MAKRDSATPLNSWSSGNEIRRISNFLKNYVSKSGAKGTVIAVSGGIDSGVSASLAVRALGKTRVTGLLLFEDGERNSKDYHDASSLISELGINSVDIPITPIFESFRKATSSLHLSKYALGNIKARIRMIVLYAFANNNDLIVIGTGDLSEAKIGYFTKYGDGGVDIQPISHLYKTEVKQIAKSLNLPESIISKPSSPHLWKGHVATDEIPIDYPKLDLILKLIDYKDSSKIASSLRIPERTVKKVIALHRKSEHKRQIPPSLSRVKKIS